MRDDESPTFLWPASLALDRWTIHVSQGLPADWEKRMADAARSDRFDLDAPEGDHFFVAVARTGGAVVVGVAQRFWPESSGGFRPGLALVAETDVLFVGAGTRLLAYHLERQELLWEDRAGGGFHQWALHPGAVLMSAELELAAWDRAGHKLWRRSTEPPWSYHVEDGQVVLDVMGEIARFPLHRG